MEIQPKNPSCPKCGFPPRYLQSEEMIASNVTGRLLDAECVARHFKCPQHGVFYAPRITGNHSTILEKKMRQLFPKKVWKKLRARLEAAERKEFNEALNGKRIVGDDKLARWQGLLSRKETGDSCETET